MSDYPQRPVATADCLMRSDLKGSGKSFPKARRASTLVNTKKSLLKYSPRQRSESLK